MMVQKEVIIMPTDKTNEIVLKQIQEKYGDQIEKFEYKVYKKRKNNQLFLLFCHTGLL